MRTDDGERFSNLSAAFYAAHADAFDATRQGPWKSWERLLETMQKSSAMASLLDIGCGNGRFATFLDSHGLSTTRYTGIDTEARFVELAETRFPDKTFRNASIAATVEEPITYDAIVAFGVFHHLPGADLRTRMLHAMGQRLNPGGVLAISLWQPRLLPNFDSKHYDGPETIGLEENDFLFGWNGDFAYLRYCHHFDNEEVEALIQGSGLDFLEQFQGTENDVSNRYVLLRRT